MSRTPSCVSPSSEHIEISDHSNSPRTCYVIPPTAPVRKLRVAAYCRVSTNHDEQLSSLDNQRQHFTELASQHPDWEFVGLYCDVVSGTRTETRPELARLLNDCTRGDIDLVLTKSVSRLARNTTDLLRMTRSLTSSGAHILFERENIDTRTMDSEFLLTILASLAEDESRSISSNCRWGLQQRFRDGSYRAANAPYGYDLVDGTYVVNEDEAPVVREVFEQRLAGRSLEWIANDLNARGIPSKRAGQHWSSGTVSGHWTRSVVGRMLSNEDYVGALRLQKTYTDESYARHVNDGSLPDYCLLNHHPAIVSKDVFAQVNDPERKSTARGRHRAKHPLAGIQFCALCGSPMYHNTTRVGTSYWVCKRHKARSTDCPLVPIPERDILDAFDVVIDRLQADDELVEELRERVCDESLEQHREDVARLEEERYQIACNQRELKRAFGTRAIEAPDYYERLAELNLRGKDVREQLEHLTNRHIHQVDALLKRLSDHNERVPEYQDEADSLMDRAAYLAELVDRVDVQGPGHFVFHFACGLVM